MAALLMTAAARRRDSEHNARMLHAWLSAAFVAKGRRLAKADLDRQLIRRAGKPQTTEQMINIARMITACHGGSVH